MGPWIARFICVLSDPVHANGIFYFTEREIKMENSRDDFLRIVSGIKPADKRAHQLARERLDSLVKPPGSLGVLEDIAARLAAVRGELYPSVDRRAVIIMAADNGVVAEGVAAAPQRVTYTQTLNFARGITGVAVLAKRYGADLIVIDVGVGEDIADPGVINKKIRRSTGNIATEPAMTEDELYRAMSVGAEAARDAAALYDVIGAGEMGIGNTTTSSAVLCALLGYDTAERVASTTGRGAGLTEEGYGRKVAVIKKALDLHGPFGADPLAALRKVGGLDLAAMTGLYIGAARYGIPVVIDGFISAVAALCAARLNPLCKDYMFASHHSYERGFAAVADELGIDAPLRFKMRLGEGSGCPLMFAVMDGACAVIKDMATFEEASVTGEYMDNIGGADAFNA